MKIIQTDKGLIKAWIDGVPVEEEAIQQVKNLTQLPFIFKHVALMPDCHHGKGSTVGSVIATKGAIIPASVGVDLNCGIMAYQTTLNASKLPDNLFELRSEIERTIPHGRTDSGGSNDRGAWKNPSNFLIEKFEILQKGYDRITDKNPALEPRKHPVLQLGTLGTGNHFIEICLDENNQVWIMLHSGSRGIGNRIGNYFISKAKEEMQKYYIDKFIPDLDLSYLVEHTEIYDEYVEAIRWAGQYATVNREIMMINTIVAMKSILKLDFSITEMAIDCHHNYAQQEHHFGSNIWVTRKGAVSARKDQFGIIPGSMGTKSFIVRGLGNPESFNSCSHGAGRVMSRTAARKLFTLEDHNRDTAGVECRRDIEVIDETPKCYKNIDDVMAAQSDLVETVHTLKQVLVVKG
jgi:tRNA-splicing ligase RtcB